jgi:hypothetical protein
MGSSQALPLPRDSRSFSKMQPPLQKKSTVNAAALATRARWKLEPLKLKYFKVATTHLQLTVLHLAVGSRASSIR